jgi:hypothetical protein
MNRLNLSQESINIAKQELQQAPVPDSWKVQLSEE